MNDIVIYASVYRTIDAIRTHKSLPIGVKVNDPGMIFSNLPDIAYRLYQVIHPLVAIPASVKMGGTSRPSGLLKVVPTVFGGFGGRSASLYFTPMGRLNHSFTNTSTILFSVTKDGIVPGFAGLTAYFDHHVFDLGVLFKGVD
jgi:hypothetical protein